MKISNLNQCIFSISLSFIFMSSTCNAEVFKWVDADGHVHYSEKKREAGATNAEVLKIKPQSVSEQEAASSAEYWREQDRKLKERQAQNQKTNTPNAPADSKTQSLSGGKSGESDESKCNLARDVMSGAVSHGNGAPIDSYDKELAKNEIRTYCH
jgi:hypothetical protein